MATVILPYGYPIQSGSAFDTVIYQGTAARAYTLPADPRTTDQLFNRRFLSDTSKVRSMLGTWGKAAAKFALGSKWATVVYQLIKADDDSRWSDAEDTWNAFPLSEQNAWRAVAPYLATFNDPGKVFFCYARALSDILLDFSGITWLAEVWGAGDSAAAAAWWAKLDTSEMVGGSYDDTASQINYVGSWQTNGFAGAYLGAVSETLSAGAYYADFYFKGLSIDLQFIKFSYYGTARVYLDGVDQGTINQYNATLLTGLFNTYVASSKGLHYVKVTADSGRINVDRVQVT